MWGRRTGEDHMCKVGEEDWGGPHVLCGGGRPWRTTHVFLENKTKEDDAISVREEDWEIPQMNRWGKRTGETPRC